MSDGPKSGGGNTYVGNSLDGSSKGHFGDNYTYIYGDRERRPPPPINCDKCSAKDIATNLHYHCAKCEDGDYDICIQCYRNGRGCHNWSDFRDARKREEEELKERYRLEAIQKEHSFKPRPPKVGSPHILSARKYVPTAEDDSIAGCEDWQLQEGAFCESCLTCCGESYWNCKTCFGGGWGFCNTCVQQGKHCSHDLVPIQEEKHCEKPDEARYAKQPPHLANDRYILLPTWHYCDTCQTEILPGESRLHCYKCSNGHFDMRLKCFNRMYKDFEMPRGFKRWRRCFHRHRMALLGGRTTSARSKDEHHQARATVSRPLGGWRMVDDLRAIAKYDPDPEAFEIGSTQTAIQSYFPDKTEVKRGHLAFPIAAKIMEVEDIDGEWAIGVYCGIIGRFPRWCVAQSRGPSRER